MLTSASSGDWAYPDGGLGARLAQYGNELPEEKVNPILKFLSYFWAPIPWMIELGAILSAVVRHWEDFGIILALLLMNAGVGFWEEFQPGFVAATA
ncbi:MAG: cation-transporting P-type ATPase [Candidatus Korobacteraceae bacterium]